jgi:hypothetical protein
MMDPAIFSVPQGWARFAAELGTPEVRRWILGHIDEHRRFAKMRRSDIVDGELLVIQEKTGTELYLPVIPELEQALRGYLAKGLALIGNEK